VVKFECGSCGFKKAVDDKYAGKNVRCPKCSNPVTVSTQQIQTPAQTANLIKIYCPLCNKKIAVPAQYAGKRVKCPSCKNPLLVEPPQSNTVPAVESIPADPAPAPIPQPLDDVMGLAAMENSAKPVDLPPEMRPAPMPQETPRSSPKMQKSGSSGFQGGIMLTVISFVIGIAIWGAIFAYVSAAKKELTKPKAQEVSDSEIKEANDFAIGCLTNLHNNDVNTVYSLLTAELKKADNKTMLETLAGSTNKFWKDDFKAMKIHIVKDPTGNLYWFTYFFNKVNVSMVVRDDADKKIIESIMSIPNANNSELSNDAVLLQSERCLELYLDAGKDYGLPILKIIGKVFFLLFIFYIIMIVSCWVVFKKAGEPGWAAIIPFYSLWVLARVADKPGYYGLSIIGLSFIPKIGGFASSVMFAILCFGIATSFNRGKLFGVGLFFFPYVFYPVLAFTKE
jgi:DNA-directed RNA polymerase subunit RPC12/RpoP